MFDWLTGKTARRQAEGLVEEGVKLGKVRAASHVLDQIGTVDLNGTYEGWEVADILNRIVTDLLVSSTDTPVQE